MSATVDPANVLEIAKWGGGLYIAKESLRLVQYVLGQTVFKAKEPVKQDVDVQRVQIECAGHKDIREWITGIDNRTQKDHDTLIENAAGTEAIVQRLDKLDKRFDHMEGMLLSAITSGKGEH